MATKKAKPKTMYWYWKGGDLAEFFEKGRAMYGTAFRVEFYPADKFGLKLVKATEDHHEGGEWNVVHVCPPDCDPD